VTLYLLRHGEAVPAKTDSERPLSEGGRRDIDTMAAMMGRLGAQVPVIYHSGKTRARESAEIVASRLGPRPEVEVMRGLSPNDDPDMAREFVQAVDRSVMLVGHLPNLPRLTSLLVTGDPDRRMVRLPTAGLIALEREGTSWHLLWLASPETVVALLGPDSPG
jgi:phosphohistidine phosphatase